MTSQKCEWKKTRYKDITALAADMGVSVDTAISNRNKYLDQHIQQLQGQAEAVANFLMTCEDELEFRFSVEELAGLNRQIVKLDRSRPVKTTADEVTEADIEVAREYPVDKLIEFKRGKATAFCHDDSNPSMYHGTRTNRAVCPVCDNKFGPIDVLMKRDGYSFLDAVRELARG